MHREVRIAGTEVHLTTWGHVEARYLSIGSDVPARGCLGIHSFQLRDVDRIAVDSTCGYAIDLAKDSVGRITHRQGTQRTLSRRDGRTARS